MQVDHSRAEPKLDLMFKKKKPEVLVVGAGPVGLFTALLLARSGIRVQIIDEAWHSATRSYALMLHADTLRLMSEVDLRTPIEAMAYRIERIGFYDAERRRHELRLTDLTGPDPFVAALPQRFLESVLIEALEHQGVQVQWNHRLSRIEARDDHVGVVIDTLEKDSVGYGIAHTEWVVRSRHSNEIPFVIGADGHRSLVRRQLDIEFDEVGPPQHFAVFEFVSDARLGREMRVMLAPNHSGVLWPLPNGSCRFSFELLGDDLPLDTRQKNRLEVDVGLARFPVIEKDRLHQYIEERAPWFKAAIGEIHWRMAVRFEKRLARKFGKGRVGLIGDAAHMAGPVGGHSMNVGIREGAALAHILLDIRENRENLQALEAYADERQEEWKFLHGLTGGLAPTDRTDPWIAGEAARVLSTIPASGDALLQLADQIGLVPNKTHSA